MKQLYALGLIPSGGVEQDCLQVTQQSNSPPTHTQCIELQYHLCSPPLTPKHRVHRSIASPQCVQLLLIYYMCAAAPHILYVCSCSSYIICVQLLLIYYMCAAAPHILYVCRCSSFIICVQVPYIMRKASI